MDGAAMSASLSRLGAAGESSLAAAAYKQIEHLIVTMELPPGSMLSETGLGERLSIGRTPIREAIKRLEREGLVIVLPRRGFMVSQINLAHHLQMLEVRGQLELLVGRTAAVRATEEQRRQMREVADAIEAAALRGDKKLFIDDSWDSHHLPVVATHNESMATAMSLFLGQSRRFWFAHSKRFANIQEVAKLHAERLRAIAGGDPDAAEADSRRLMNYLEAFARSTVDYSIGRSSAQTVIGRQAEPEPSSQ